MKYLICYVWNNTKTNHAGMSHMCDLLKQKWPQEFKVIKFYEAPIVQFFPSKKLNRIAASIVYRLFRFYSNICFRIVVNKLKATDKVYLLEYISSYIDMARMGALIKNRNPKVQTYGLVHLTPSYFIQIKDMNAEKFQYWDKNISHLLTFGSTLTAFLHSMGIPKSKISTLFHYVNNEYYHRNTTYNNDKVTVIVQGNLQRNYTLLEKIVATCHDVDFIICAGMRQLNQFNKYDNVKLLGFISEEELKNEMERADVSLNVMDDTIGSNVIVTSMSMGLAIIVSDVGSIRDYCDETNAIFCKTENEYIEALQSFINNGHKLQSMQISSIKKSECFTIEKFHNALNVMEEETSKYEKATISNVN